MKISEGGNLSNVKYMPCLETKQLIKVLLIKLHMADALLMVNVGVQSKWGNYICIQAWLSNLLKENSLEILMQEWGHACTNTVHFILSSFPDVSHILLKDNCQDYNPELITCFLTVELSSSSN